jgi:hypothetical protein
MIPPDQGVDAYSGRDELLKEFVKAVQSELLLLQMDTWMGVKLPEYTLNDSVSLLKSTQVYNSQNINGFCFRLVCHYPPKSTWVAVKTAVNPIGSHFSLPHTQGTLGVKLSV